MIRNDLRNPKNCHLKNYHLLLETLFEFTLKYGYYEKVILSKWKPH